MSLHVEWTPAAERDLRRLDRRTQTRIRLRVTRFATTGEGDVRRLRGYEREWRLRVGQWRVRFTLSPDPQTLCSASCRAGKPTVRDRFLTVE